MLETHSDPEPSLFPRGQRQIQRQVCSSLTLRFAGDSGDGMQVTGDRFAALAAIFGNDVLTLADYPAEIRAPQGTLYGVSGYQIRLGSTPVFTSGDEVDILVAMNPAALMSNKNKVRAGGLILADSDAFTEKNCSKINLPSNPLEDATLAGFTVHAIPITSLTRAALEASALGPHDKSRCKNFYTLGLVCWLLGKPIEPGLAWIRKKFAKKPLVAEANALALKEGHIAGEVREFFSAPLYVPELHERRRPGTYRFLGGNTALALGIIAAGKKAQKNIFYAGYPITPASSLLHELCRHRNFAVTTFQAEDEIAAIGSALGASYAGSLAVTGTSGPGLALKAEFLGLAVMAELPLVVIDVQRSGPSTGMPTKTEQTDLLMSLWGRNGESPLVVLAASSPADCFAVAYEACRIAMTSVCPVIVLSDAYLANGHEAWRIPLEEELAAISLPCVPDLNEGEAFLPYARCEETLARPWVSPGRKGFEHRIGGLEKEHLTGGVSQDPDNHQKMVQLRAAKIARVAQDFPPLQVFGPRQGKVLVLGWGSTFGAIRRAVTELQARGYSLAQVHLRHLNPLPQDLDSLLQNFEVVLIPECNLGQLVIKLRYEYPSVNFISLPKVSGQPFTPQEISSKLSELVEVSLGERR